MKPQFSPFGHFVFRTPLFPLAENSEIPAPEIFNEAIYLASPELSAGNKSNDPKKRRKFEDSMLKYRNRASTRCTPFGLFAGCSAGTIGGQTVVELLPPASGRRVTRLDMQYLCALIQHIERMPDVRRQLRFRPNDSLYRIGGKYRFVAYHYKKSQRQHEVISLEIDDPLDQLLEAAKDGATIGTLTRLFMDEGITPEEAVEYIDATIDSQVLKSELDPCVVGEDVFTTLLDKLARLENVAVLEPLRRIRDLLTEIDARPIGSTLPLYSEIIKLVETIGVGYEVKFLFQTDLFKPTRTAVVSSEVTSRLDRLIRFLAKITPSTEHPGLSSFTQAFQSRYEEAEVPLATALDRELGIGYPVSADKGNDISPLINELFFPGRTSYVSELRLMPADRILLQKYTDCIRNGDTVVKLSDKDFEGFDFTHTLPDTLSVMCSLLADGKIHVKSVGGTSGANLLGRFCHIDPAISALVTEIAAFEQRKNPDRIIAEISHLPESRIGNIASRPSLRQYTLHYLSNCDDREHTIPVSDLMLSVRNGRLFLRSRKYDQEVLPRLTCAHNYSLSPIPVYRFLCDLQHQGITSGLYLGWNGFFDALDYLPRIQYGDFILSRQRWRLKPEEVDEFSKLPERELTKHMQELMARRQLVRHVIVPDSDNELYLDLEDSRCQRLFLEMVGKRKGLMLEEFLFTAENAVVRQGGNAYTNEFQFVFHQ